MQGGTSSPLPEPPSLSGTLGGPAVHPFGVGGGPGAHRDHGLTRSCGAHSYPPHLPPPVHPREGWGGGPASERHLTGTASFLADLSHQDALEVAFVRSPFAHARIGAIAGAGATAADLGLRDIVVDGRGLRPRPWAAL